jgi:hypothetical protein
LRRDDFRRALRQHGDAARGMEAAHDDLNAGIAELPADIDGAWELVRLHADQADHGAVRFLQPADQLFEADDGIGLIDHVDLDVDVVP